MLKCMHCNQVGDNRGVNMYNIIPMHRTAAEEISIWDFGKGYEFYNIEEDPYVIETFLNGHYYIVYKNDEIFGFFCDGESARINETYPEDDDILDVGFALNPHWISQKMGEQLLNIMFQYYHALYDVHIFRLTVASFNVRGIKLYERMGFYEVNTFYETIDNENIKFIVMCYNQSQD